MKEEGTGKTKGRAKRKGKKEGTEHRKRGAGKSGDRKREGQINKEREKIPGNPGEEEGKKWIQPKQK